MSDNVPLAVGLKYCGGCRAEYDRVDLVEWIKKQLGNRVRFVRHDSPEAQIILAVHGCTTACADLASVGGRLVWSVTSPKEAALIVHHVQKMISQM